jgi:hypothetical protein
MKVETVTKGWRRWREAAFATCTAWLVLQNMVLLALVAWGRPAEALAAGGAIARTAAAWGGALVALGLAVAAGLALAAWLVHAPATSTRRSRTEVADGR